MDNYKHVYNNKQAYNNKQSYNNKQTGLTLVELLISVAISMLVVGAVASAYVITATSSITSLQNIKLNESVTNAMAIMAGDIRRAGYWGTADPDVLVEPTNNPFNQVNNTALTVFDMTNPGVPLGSRDAGNCITFAYELNDDNNDATAPALDDTDILGFRLNNGVIQMRTEGDPAVADDCDDGAPNVWSDITDGNLITITQLDFDLADSACINTREPDGIDNNLDGTIDEDAELDCYTTAADAGDTLVESREVKITIRGELRNDDSVSVTAVQTAKVRNELVSIAP